MSTTSPESRCRAVDLARREGASQVAEEFGVSESGLRRWMAQDDVDAGRKEGLSTSEREELVQLRRETRRQQTESEIVKRGSACFAQENVVGK